MASPFTKGRGQVAASARPVPPPPPDASDWDTPEAPSTVRVRCIVHSRPHTHEAGLGLKHGEEADVPADVAALMTEKGQVVTL